MGLKKSFDSKDNIIRVAFSLFLKKGFKEVTITNIMEVTKLSKGAIYHHFKSKEEIYAATLETYYFELLQPDGVDFNSGSFKKDIESLYNYVAELFHNIENISKNDSDYPIRNYFSFQLESEKNTAIRGQTTQAVAEFRKTVEDIVINGFSNHQIKPELDVKTITLQIIGMVEGVAVHHSTLKDNVKEILLKKYQLVFDSFLSFICNE
ncbi:TetR/AcrR family transcriptional regulator [Urechidicola vernalis]|uniref:TetR/AcrR family transcriptional regulator n=1 Tax=Urechidicola vernalis TaxID=3075600 RepID=A0ABU2Y4U9_9FLAO|nr:TetR/AcrR family transcriptional regulator [Urechidicola sp. P050]MDT0553222.1 TetR/AcrR family transcriptional regulator [Urechidicola sp. P050]